VGQRLDSNGITHIESGDFAAGLKGKRVQQFLIDVRGDDARTFIEKSQRCGAANALPRSGQQGSFSSKSLCDSPSLCSI
jgi:hypothetical protein